MEVLTSLGLSLLPAVILVSLRVGVALVSFPAPFSDGAPVQVRAALGLGQRPLGEQGVGVAVDDSHDLVLLRGARCGLLQCAFVAPGCHHRAPVRSLIESYVVNCL